MSAKKPAAKAKEKTSKSRRHRRCREAQAFGRSQGIDAGHGRPLQQDRRQNDRRQKDAPVEVDRRSTERRVKVNRRRQIDPTTCERDYSPEEVEFMAPWTTTSVATAGCSPRAARFLKSSRPWATKSGPNCPPSRQPAELGRMVLHGGHRTGGLSAKNRIANLSCVKGPGSLFSPRIVAVRCDLRVRTAAMQPG